MAVGLLTGILAGCVGSSIAHDAPRTVQVEPVAVDYSYTLVDVDVDEGDVPLLQISEWKRLCIGAQITDCPVETDLGNHPCPFCKVRANLPPAHAVVVTDSNATAIGIKRRGRKKIVLQIFPSRRTNDVLPQIHDLSGAPTAWVDILVAEALDGFGA